MKPEVFKTFADNTRIHVDRLIIEVESSREEFNARINELQNLNDSYRATILQMERTYKKLEKEYNELVDENTKLRADQSTSTRASRVEPRVQ